MRRALVLAAVAALTASGLAAGASPAAAAIPPSYVVKLQTRPTVSTVSAVTASCPKTIVYVSRGSDENRTTASSDYANSALYPKFPEDDVAGSPNARAKYYGGVGEEMSPLVNYLTSLYPAGDVKVVANTDAKYPATGFDLGLLMAGTLPDDFANSIVSGATAMIKDLNDLHACANSKLVIVGYSQGAVATHLALTSAVAPVNGQSLSFSPLANQAVTLLFGDGLWNRDPAAYGGSYSGDVMAPGALPASDEEGAATWLYSHDIPFPQRAAFAPRALAANWNLTSWCHGTDPWCQFAHQSGQLALNVPGHLTYDQEDFYGAANRAASVLASSMVSGGTSYAAKANRTTVSFLTNGTTDATATSRACLKRNASFSRTVTSIASPTGSGSKTVTPSWTPATITHPAGGAVSVAAGGTATVTGAQTSAFPTDNDVWALSVTDTFATATTPVSATLKIYSARICPAA